MKRGEVGGNRDVLAGREGKLVIEALAAGDRASNRAAESERGQRDLHRIGRCQFGAGAVELGHKALAVGEDDDVVITGREAGDRSGDGLRVLAVGGDSGLVEATEQDGAGIEGRLGGEIDGVGPRACRGVGAFVVDLVGDCEVLAGDGVGGDGKWFDDEVGGAGDGVEGD